MITSFLVAIPVHATPTTKPSKIKTETAQYAGVTIIASNGSENLTFEVALIVPDLTAMSTEEAIADVASQIHFTEEQRALILNSSSVRIMESTGSYAEILRWFNFWGIPFGVVYHVYLSAIDAINIETALDALIVVFGLLAVILGVVTIVGGILVAVALAILGMIRADYGRMYDADHNYDNSFDVWGEDTIYQIWQNWANMETPRYVWMVTGVGAYITRDKTVNPNPIIINPSEWYEIHGGGTRARSI